jgi:hypothetical protein
MCFFTILLLNPPNKDITKFIDLVKKIAILLQNATGKIVVDIFLASGGVKSRIKTRIIFIKDGGNVMRKLLLSLFSVSLIVTSSSSAISCGNTYDSNKYQVNTALGYVDVNTKYKLEFGVVPTKDTIFEFVKSTCRNQDALTAKNVVGKVTLESYKFSNNNLTVTLILVNDNLEADDREEYQYSLDIDSDNDSINDFFAETSKNLKIETIKSWYDSDDKEKLNTNMNLYFNSEFANFTNEKYASFSRFISNSGIELKLQPSYFFFYDESGFSLSEFSNRLSNNNDINIVYFECTRMELQLGSVSYDIETTMLIGEKPQTVNFDAISVRDEAVQAKSKNIDLPAAVLNVSSGIMALLNLGINNFYIDVLSANISSFPLDRNCNWWGEEMNSKILIEYNEQSIPMNYDENDNDCFAEFVAFVNEKNNKDENPAYINDLKLIITVGDNEWFTGTLEFNFNLMIDN